MTEIVFMYPVSSDGGGCEVCVCEKGNMGIYIQKCISLCFPCFNESSVLYQHSKLYIITDISVRTSCCMIVPFLYPAYQAHINEGVWSSTEQY